MEINPDVKLIIHVGRARIVIDVTNAVRVSTGKVEFRARIEKESQRLRGIAGYGDSVNSAITQLVERIALFRGVKI